MTKNWLRSVIVESATMLVTPSVRCTPAVAKNGNAIRGRQKLWKGRNPTRIKYEEIWGGQLERPDDWRDRLEWRTWDGPHNVPPNFKDHIALNSLPSPCPGEHEILNDDSCGPSLQACMDLWSRLHAQWELEDQNPRQAPPQSGCNNNRSGNDDSLVYLPQKAFKQSPNTQIISSCGDNEEITGTVKIEPGSTTPLCSLKQSEGTLFPSYSTNVA